MPEKLAFLFEPHRYKAAYGGRGSAKSWSFARALIIKAVSHVLRVLCLRELQNSIQESVYRLLCDQIDLMGFNDDFTMTQTSIRGVNGSEFFFYGIKNNPSKIKSTEGVDIAWVEEAQRLSEDSWKILIPTIRKDRSEIWLSFNPDQETDPTYKRFVLNPPNDCVSRQVNWQDNPWFPEELKKEKEYLARVDMDAYLHIYEGKCRKHTQAQVLGGKCSIEAFEPEASWSGPYFGADWGFANDPSTLIKSWINGKSLYIEYEVYGVGIDIDKLPEYFDRIPGSRKYAIRGDNARPETMSYLRQHGFPKIAGAEKWKGSVEDGIAYLRQFERIVIHSRCTHTIDESRLWCYKTDPLTGDVLPDLIDAHNHCWDAIRYALQPMIKNSGMTGMLDYYADMQGKEKERRGQIDTTHPWQVVYKRGMVSLRPPPGWTSAQRITMSNGQAVEIGADGVAIIPKELEKELTGIGFTTA